jgi:TPP-dependent pyruvate/acetoin dehydrogenase alpha subunit
MDREKLYEKMLTIRLFEERAESLFIKGELFGTIHACVGQEAVSVGIISNLKKSDLILSNHRGHGHFIAFTDDVEGIISELMGKESGVCSGRGGSQHLCTGNFFTNGITCGMTAVATGMAYAEKRNKTDNIVVVFIGDGALGEGVLYESMNMASLWNLPILFVVENNKYAMSTHIKDAVAGSIIERGKSFGIKSEEIPGDDVEFIIEKTKGIIDNIRKKKEPFFLVCDTYRFCGHSKSDDRSYRTKKEEEEMACGDPLHVVLGLKIDNKTKKKIEEKVRKRLDDAFKKAEEASFPSSLEPLPYKE